MTACPEGHDSASGNFCHVCGQRIGQGSFDGIANSISQMFNFTQIRPNGILFLNPSTGEIEK